MGKHSPRKELIQKLKASYKRKKRLLQLLAFDSKQDSFFEIMQIITIRAKKKYEIAVESRYLNRVKYHLIEPEFESYLYGDFLNQSEFKAKYRMERAQFWKLVEMIKDHSAFEKSANGRNQAPVEHQLLALLFYLGNEGLTGKIQRFALKCSYGTAFKYCKRCVAAIIDTLYKSTVKWPDELERKRISARMKQDFEFPGCVGVLDGTLFNLAFTSSTEVFADYHGRKGKYTMTCMIVNDDQKMIQYFHAG